MLSKSTRRGRRFTAPRLFALIAGVLLAATVGFYADAATTIKPYTATWLNGSDVPVANPLNQLSFAAGSLTLKLRIWNNAGQQTLGSADITPPTTGGYTLQAGSSVPGGGSATLSGNTLQLRNLGLLPGSSLDVTIKVATGCLGDGVYRNWTLTVKQANDFSGPPGNNFSIKSGTVPPATAVTTSLCSLRFANQPNTTKTGNTIKSGYDSTGDAIQVEIYDPGTGNVVDSSAQVALALYYNPAGGNLSGGAATAASHGVATFASLSINKAGAYRLQASSAAASNAPISNLFMVADAVETCASAACNFTQTQGQNAYNLDPTTGTSGATYVGALNLSGLKISCQFAPYNYLDSRQPNSVWFNYEDGTTQSEKIITILIDKKSVQATSNNGTSFYRVCFSSPLPFKDRDGSWAPSDPWLTPDIDGNVGPSTYFGTTWYTGLLPDCSAVNDVAPCVISWTGSQGGDRIGTFRAPPGDPIYR